MVWGGGGGGRGGGGGLFSFFFFNDTATTEIYTLSLHDALPISIQPYASRIDERDSQLPTILFVCSMNSVRSPMAAALARYLFPGKLIARSAGARSGKADSFVHRAMEELGVDMSVHTPHTMDELVATKFDLVITLSGEAKEAVARRKLDAKKTEHWVTEDPTLVGGSREIRLSAYHQLRDGLKKRIGEHIGPMI